MFDELSRYLWDLYGQAHPISSDKADLEDQAIRTIVTRTLGGTSVNGAPFAAYSRKGPIYKEGQRYASYEAYKVSLGRTVPDLAGRDYTMLSSIKSRATGDPSEVAFGIYDTTLAVIAETHNEGTHTAGRNHNITIPKREWWGLSERDQDALGLTYEQRVIARLDRL